MSMIPSLKNPRSLSAFILNGRTAIKDLPFSPSAAARDPGKAVINKRKAHSDVMKIPIEIRKEPQRTLCTYYPLVIEKTSCLESACPLGLISHDSAAGAASVLIFVPFGQDQQEKLSYRHGPSTIRAIKLRCLKVLKAFHLAAISLSRPEHCILHRQNLWLFKPFVL